MLNNVALQGRLTAAPELKTTQSGVSVCSFTLAVERHYKNGGEKQTDFINCVAWRHTAEFVCQYFGKGQMMVVSGELQTRKYQTNDSSTRHVTEVMVSDVNFGGDKQPQASAAPAFTTPNVGLEDVVIDEDALPF